MAELDSELLQILFAEVGQHGDIDLGLDERRTVLAEPQFFQPLDNGLHRANACPEAWLLSTGSGSPAEEKAADQKSGCPRQARLKSLAAWLLCPNGQLGR